MLPSVIAGVSVGLVGGVTCVTLLVIYRCFRTKKKHGPGSPDYRAVGDFKPPSLFSWDSATSISFVEESHSVQPKLAPIKSYQAHPAHRDDISISTTSTALSGTSHGSFRSSRTRTLSEASSGSVDSYNYDTSSTGIQPELYTRKNAVLRQESSKATLGRLHVRLKYDFRTSDLIVHLIEAQDLQAYDRTAGFSDPFIRLNLDPPGDTKCRQSSVRHRTTNPLYNEYFKFPIGFEDLKEKSLIFNVFDFDKFSHNELIGEVRIDFSSIDVSTTVEVWCDIEPSVQVEEGMGELLVSLSYLPTAERLTVVIMKARALKLPKGHKFEPVVRASLVVDGKVTKKKKTTVTKCSCNPVWNEALVFNVPPNTLPHVKLELAVIDRDLLGHGDALGYITLGKDQEGLERNHWREMMNNVRKAVAKWHILHAS